MKKVFDLFTGELITKVKKQARKGGRQKAALVMSF